MLAVASAREAFGPVECARSRRTFRGANGSEGSGKGYLGEYGKSGAGLRLMREDGFAMVQRDGRKLQGRIAGSKHFVNICTR